MRDSPHAPNCSLLIPNANVSSELADHWTNPVESEANLDLRQSHVCHRQRSSGFWGWWSQIPRADGVCKTLALVRPVAKWLVRRMTATAKRYRRTTTQTEGLSFLIYDLKISFHFDGTIIENCDLGSCQRTLREIFPALLQTET